MTTCWWLPANHYPGHVRVHLPARALGAHVRTLDLDAVEQEHQDGGTAVFRYPTTPRAVQAITLARRLGARVVVDSDDNLLGERVRRLLALNNSHFYVPSRLAADNAAAEVRAAQHAFLDAVRAADAVTVASRALADVHKPFNPNVLLVANQVDPADWAHPDTNKRDGVFRVGFAGSGSHIDDLHLVRDALAWAAQQDHVEVVFAGCHPKDKIPTPELEELAGPVQASYGLSWRDPANTRLQREALTIASRRFRRWAFPVTVVPWTDDYRAYAANLARFDVGLCPGDDATALTPYRSDLKPLEYLMAGALPLVSRSRAYSGWCDRLPAADTPEQFTHLVRWAAANQDEVRERALELREHVLAERTIQQNAWRWEQALQGG